MLVPGIIGFQGLLLLLILLSFFVICHKWKNAAAKKEEILRLVAMASEETAVAEFQATAFFAPVVQPASWPYHCAVCYASTTMRCSKCKAVRYWFVFLLKVIIFLAWFVHFLDGYVCAFAVAV